MRRSKVTQPPPMEPALKRGSRPGSSKSSASNHFFRPAKRAQNGRWLARLPNSKGRIEFAANGINAKTVACLKHKACLHRSKSVPHEAFPSKSDALLPEAYRLRRSDPHQECGPYSGQARLTLFAPNSSDSPGD